jgi:hypothetical protein
MQLDPSKLNRLLPMHELAARHARRQVLTRLPALQPPPPPPPPPAPIPGARKTTPGHLLPLHIQFRTNPLFSIL